MIKGTGGQQLSFARAVEADGWLYVSGQVPMVKGELVCGTILAQSHQAIQNLLSVLKEAGYSPEHVVRCGVWLDDPRDFQAFNQVFREYSVANPPARACVISSMVIDLQSGDRLHSVQKSIRNDALIVFPEVRLRSVATKDLPCMQGIDHHAALLLTSALGSVIILIVLIARFKLNPFVALLTVSLALAIATRMPLPTIVKSFEAGLGGTLGHIAIVVALGTMLGKMMAESGGSDRIAQTLIEFFGEKRAP